MTTNYLQFATESEAKIAADSLRDPAKGLHAQVMRERPLIVELVFNAPDAGPMPTPVAIPAPVKVTPKAPRKNGRAMVKRLKLKKAPSDFLTMYQGRPFYGVTASIAQTADEPGKNWRAGVCIEPVEYNGTVRNAQREFRTLADAAAWVNGFGAELVPSKNLMSGKVIEVTRATYGTACDPGTERYWSM